MENTLERIALCVEVGKINAKTPYPPAMKGEDGADELTQKALEQGYSPNDILTKGLIVGMNNIGVKFKENKVFVPQVLMSAKAMSGGMQHLKRYFNDGSVKRKGKLIIGTVKGDLHDIGKNLVCMMVEGNGYDYRLGGRCYRRKVCGRCQRKSGCFCRNVCFVDNHNGQYGVDQYSYKGRISSSENIYRRSTCEQRFCSENRCRLLYRRASAVSRDFKPVNI